MATTIYMIKLGVKNSPMWGRTVSIPSKVMFKNPTCPKLWYYIVRTTGDLYLKGTYIPTSSYEKQKKQIFNNIPIGRIERKLVSSRMYLKLTMEEIKQFINELRTISNRKEE